MQSSRSSPGSDRTNDPPIQSWYDAHASEFIDADVIEHGFVGQSPEFQARLNRFKLWAIDHSGFVNVNGKHVLEFGAGHARLALAFPGMASYTGVDYSKKLVALGNERLRKAGLSDRATVVHGDVASFDAPHSHFDVVCSLGLICHFPDPAPIVTKMQMFLRPGGVLFFDFRIASLLYAPLRRLKWALRPPSGGTTFCVHPAYIEALLTGLGFKNVRIRLRELPFLAERYASR